MYSIETCLYLVPFLRYSASKNGDFFIPLVFDATVSGVTVGILPYFGVEKLEWCGYPTVEKR